MDLNEEIRRVNDEIEDMENDVLTSKLAYEEEKAKLWVECDFPTAIGIAKPTVAQKESYVKLETLHLKERVEQGEIILNARKRLFAILLRELGDKE